MAASECVMTKTPSFRQAATMTHPQHSHKPHPVTPHDTATKHMAELLDTDPQPLVYWDRKQFTHFQDQVRKGGGAYTHHVPGI